MIFKNKLKYKTPYEVQANEENMCKFCSFNKSTNCNGIACFTGIDTYLKQNNKRR